MPPRRSAEEILLDRTRRAAEDILLPPTPPVQAQEPDLPPTAPPELFLSAIPTTESRALAQDIAAGFRDTPAFFARAGQAFASGLVEAPGRIATGLATALVPPGEQRPEPTIEREVAQQFVTRGGGLLEALEGLFLPLSRVGREVVGPQAGEAARRFGAPERLAKGVEVGFAELPVLATIPAEAFLRLPVPGTIPRGARPRAVSRRPTPEAEPVPARVAPAVERLPETTVETLPGGARITTEGAGQAREIFDFENTLVSQGIITRQEVPVLRRQSMDIAEASGELFENVHSRTLRQLGSVEPAVTPTPPLQLKSASSAQEILTGEPKPSQVATGRISTAKTEAGTPLEFQFAVVDARDVIASNDATGRINPRFPKELQPRDRTRVSSQAQLRDFQKNLEPSRLGDSVRVANGAPIVGEDLIVESGNLRVMGIVDGYARDLPTLKRYREFVIRQAEEFGLTAEEVRRIERPLLVRVRRTPIDRSRFGIEANVGTATPFSATEQALADATRISGRTLELFQATETGEIATAGNRPFLRAFAEDVVSTTEMGRFFDATGVVSQEGILRVRNALFASAFDNPSTLVRLAESTDNNIRDITGGLL
ncbi:hypothetical protein LCGC14_2077790, partial [marine sediment metagenome]